MPKMVNHKKRKSQILTQALEIFASLGYEETTMTQIATISKISRPTLYQYFQNKEEIIYFAIKTKTDSLLLAYLKEVQTSILPANEKLTQLCTNMLTFMYDQKDFIKSIIGYIYHQQFHHAELTTMIRKRTIRLEHLITALIKEGVQTGVFTKQLDPTESERLLWHLFIAIAVEISTIDYPKKEATRRITAYIDLLGC